MVDAVAVGDAVGGGAVALGVARVFQATTGDAVDVVGANVSELSR